MGLGFLSYNEAKNDVRSQRAAFSIPIARSIATPALSPPQPLSSGNFLFKCFSFTSWLFFDCQK